CSVRFEAAYSSDQLQPCAHGSLCVVLVRLGIAEVNQNPIAHVLGYKAAEAPNLAARLQGVAEPNSVVIAESTRKLVGNLFELENLGVQDLKGIAGPVGAWAALRSSLVESRFEAFHASGLTELVG